MIRVQLTDTDVEVTSLTDRRKIKALEIQVEDLSAKLARALDRVQPGLSKAPHTECYHRGSFLVSDHNLEVTCKLCGAKMDPYVVLRKIAHREVNFCYQLNDLRAESERLAKEIKTLKAARARLRSQISKATPDTPIATIAETIRRLDAKVFAVKKVSSMWAATMKLADHTQFSSGLQSSVEVAVDRIVRAAISEASPIAEGEQA